MATIKTVLDLDRSKFDQSVDLGVKKFQAAFGKVNAPTATYLSKAGEEIGQDVSRKLNRSFGAGDAFKGLLMGAGLGTVEKIAEKIAEHWKAAAESAEKILTFSERSLKATLALIDLRRTDQQRLADLRKDAGKLRNEMDEHDVQRAVKRGIEYKGPMDPERAAEVDALLKENALAQAQLQKKLAEDLARKAEEKGKKEREVLEKANKNWDEWLAAVKEYREKEARKDREEEAEKERQNMRNQTELYNAEQGRDAARDNLTKATKNYQANKDDFLAVDLQSAAAGGPATGRDRARAREALRLEERAKRVAAMGGDYRDEETGRTLSAKEYAGRLQNRAENLRQAGNFKQADKDPYGAKEMKTAADELKKAAKELANVEATVEVAP